MTGVSGPGGGWVVRRVVIVCGGRHYGEPTPGLTGAALAWDKARVQREREHLTRYLNGQHATHCIRHLIHGDARGADSLAGDWALQQVVVIEPVPALWRKLGKTAGRIRNREMLSKLLVARVRGEDVQVIAFPGGSGTDHMINAALAEGVIVLRPGPAPMEGA